MSTPDATAADTAGLQALQERLAVEAALYKYSESVDSFDIAGIRSVLADEIHAQYGNGEPVTDPDALVSWIDEATASAIWQHHLLNVYRVDVDGDHASALSYLTSYQVFEANPDAAVILVARYHDELRRTGDGWKIARRIMEVLWGENRAADGFLESIGGRGPKLEPWQRG